MARLIAVALLALVALACVGAPFAEARSSMLRKQGVEAKLAEPVDSSDDDSSDDDKEEKEFEENVKTAREDVRIKTLASKAALERLRHYRPDDSKMKAAKVNLTLAMEHEQEIKETMDEMNSTFIESEKELALAKNLSAKVSIKEDTLKNESSSSNATYKFTRANVTNLRMAEEQAKEHLTEVELSDAKRQIAKRLKLAVAKVKSLKAVGAGHEAFEALREELSAIKMHKKKKDMDHDSIFAAIKQAKEHAKRVKVLRKNLEEAEAAAHNAKSELDNITRTRKLPVGYAPGDAATEFESKTSTIEQWINALDLEGKEKTKNETAKRFWDYTRGKYKETMLALNNSAIAEIYAKNNFTLIEKTYFNASLEALKAKHNFDILRTAYYAERTFDVATMKEHARAAEVAERLSKEKLERMVKAEKVMRETAKKTQDAVDALHKSMETHAAFIKSMVSKPYVPPHMENGHGVDAMTANSPLAAAAKALVWGDQTTAENAVESIMQEIQSKANESALVAVAKGPNAVAAQAAKIFKKHPSMTAAKSHRFREALPSQSHKASGWVTPGFGDDSKKAKDAPSHHRHHHHHHHHSHASESRFQALRGKLVTVSTSGMPSKASLGEETKTASKPSPILKTQPSHCFDGKKDNGEVGVDCGGTCARACGFHRVKMEHVANKDGYKEVQMVPSTQFAKSGTSPEIVRKLECGKGVDCSKAKDYRPVHYSSIGEK